MGRELELWPEEREVAVLGFPRVRPPSAHSVLGQGVMAAGELLLIYTGRNQASVTKAARGFAGWKRGAGGVTTLEGSCFRAPNPTNALCSSMERRLLGQQVARSILLVAATPPSAPTP